MGVVVIHTGTDIAKLPPADQFDVYQKRLADGGEVIFRGTAKQKDSFALVTVITPTFNSSKVVGEAIESVVQQTYPSIELILVDGASKDDTVQRLLSLSDKLSMIISGPDDNPADALNKGICLSKGEFIVVLPSDDKLPPDFVSRAVEAINRTGSDYVFGDLIYTVKGEPPVLVKGDADYRHSIEYKMPAVNSTSMLIRRRCFERIGLFDKAIKYCPDYEWVRRAHKFGLVGRYDPAIQIFFAHGGMSTINYGASLREVCKVAIAYGCPAPRAYVAYYRGVVQKSVKDVLQAILPRGLFYWVLGRATRTGMRPMT